MDERAKKKPKWTFIMVTNSIFLFRFFQSFSADIIFVLCHIKYVYKTNQLFSRANRTISVKQKEKNFVRLKKKFCQMNCESWEYTQRSIKCERIALFCFSVVVVVVIPVYVQKTKRKKMKYNQSNLLDNENSQRYCRIVIKIIISLYQQVNVTVRAIILLW